MIFSTAAPKATILISMLMMMMMTLARKSRWVQARELPFHNFEQPIVRQSILCRIVTVKSRFNSSYEY